MKLSLGDEPYTATLGPLKTEGPPAQAHHSLEIVHAKDEDLSEVRMSRGGEHIIEVSQGGSQEKIESSSVNGSMNNQAPNGQEYKINISEYNANEADRKNP